MFGSFRFILAFLVLLTHLLGLAHIGQFAVFGFYTLSGYLMTLVMNERYQYQLSGLAAFWKNRALRLLPTYWIACLLALLVIMLIGAEQIKQFNPRMGIPDNAFDWFQNSFIAFISLNPFDVTPRLTTVSWAVTVELFYYLVISLGLARYLKVVLIWVTLSIFYHALSLSHDIHYIERYMPIVAASLPFSVGALIYHLRKRQTRIDSHQYWYVIGALLISFIPFEYLVLAYKSGKVNNDVFTGLLNTQFYVAYILIATSIYLIARSKAKLSETALKIDKILGDISYPLYLFHLQVYFFVCYVTIGRPDRSLSESGITAFALSVALTIVLCLMSVFWVEKPIERIRDMIKLKTAGGKKIENDQEQEGLLRNQT